MPLALGKLWSSSQRQFGRQGEEQDSEAGKVWGAPLGTKLFPWGDLSP